MENTLKTIVVYETLLLKYVVIVIANLKMGLPRLILKIRTPKRGSIKLLNDALVKCDTLKKRIMFCKETKTSIVTQAPKQKQNACIVS
ncbi:MAG: hypothetical protein E6K54_08500 [Gammaproteobacteria bacterium]|nr:MAG: hypothetical protein E6K54_08500 [Gammaproteobacteria bacterium]